MRASALVFTVLLSVTCSPPPTPEPDAGPPPNLCVGGIVIQSGPDAGWCIAKCDPSKCLAGNTCVNNECQLKCTSHFDCNATEQSLADGGFPLPTQRCLPATEDDTMNAIMTCQDVDLKGIGSPCPQGTECSAGTNCQTAGLGDTTAYCTAGCVTDTDCPGGYECGPVRQPTWICENSDAGESFCGKAPAACTPRSSYEMNPQVWIGNICVELRQCLKRTACSACQTDSDCSLSFEKCAQVGIGFRCLATCTVFPDGGANNKDCEQGYHCVADDGLCHPAFTDCVSPPHQFCSPCRYDTDCETDAGGFLECQNVHGNERSCIDVSFPQTCTKDADCPLAPSGLHGHCLNESDEVVSGDPLYHHCYIPKNSMGAFSCYPAN
jgi:hypothetical protein